MVLLPFGRSLIGFGESWVVPQRGGLESNTDQDQYSWTKDKEGNGWIHETQSNQLSSSPLNNLEDEENDTVEPYHITPPSKSIEDDQVTTLNRIFSV